MKNVEEILQALRVETEEDTPYGTPRRTLRVTGASRHHTADVFAGLTRPGVYITVAHYPWKGRTKDWFVDCCFYQDDKERSCWCPRSVWETREQAAQEAADFALAALPLLVKSLRTGQRVWTPRDRRAAAVAVKVEETTRELRAEVARLTEGVRKAIDEDRPSWSEVRSKRDRKRSQLYQWERDLEAELYRLQPWQMFAGEEV